MSYNNLPYNLRLAMGKVKGHSTINKFGFTGEIQTADPPVDIWEYGVTQPLYPFSTLVDIDSLSSSSASDTGDIEVQGLDASWKVVVQTITLTGQTRVALATPLIRCFRMKAAAAVTGTIYCYVNSTISSGVPSDSAKVRATITPTSNQTQLAIYTIPAGATGYLDRYTATVNKNKAGVLIGGLYARQFGGIFQNKGIFSLNFAGNTVYQREFNILPTFAEKTDILIRVLEVSANDVGIAAEFDILLIS